MDDQLSRDLAGLAPSVDEGAAWARITRRRTSRKRRLRTIQAAVPVVLAASIATAAIQLGEDDAPSVRTADNPDRSVADSSEPSCEATDRLNRHLGDLGMVVDYEPSDSPADLREMADAVVVGTLERMTHEAEVHNEWEVDEWLAFTVRVEQAVKGDLAQGDDIVVRVSYNSALVDATDIEAAFTPGIRAVLFMAGSPESTGWGTFVEGFWITCPGHEPQLTASYGNQPSWRVETVEELTGAD